MQRRQPRDGPSTCAWRARGASRGGGVQGELQRRKHRPLLPPPPPSPPLLAPQRAFRTFSSSLSAAEAASFWPFCGHRAHHLLLPSSALRFSPPFSFSFSSSSCRRRRRRPQRQTFCASWGCGWSPFDERTVVERRRPRGGPEHLSLLIFLLLLPREVVARRGGQRPVVVGGGGRGDEKKLRLSSRRRPSFRCVRMHAVFFPSVNTSFTSASRPAISLLTSSTRGK